MRRRFVVVGLLAGLVLPLFGGTPASASSAPGITAASAILVSLNNPEGRVLYARRIHDSRPPASLTKVVTALVARDEYRLDDVVVASPLVLQTHGTDLGLEPGMRVTVKDLLYATLLKSANDAAMALAAHHPLGYEHFVALMNQKARSLGARDSLFRNPHGLDQIGHVSSAWDMALFTRELLADPVLADIVATKEHRMPWHNGGVRVFDNHNKLITRYPGTIGVKTGFTEQAGHCLITAARTPDGTAFTVVLNSQDHYSDTIALLDYAKALEVRVGSGGGDLDIGRALALPPAAPPEDVKIASSLLGLDPRDDARWLAVLLVIGVLTLATIARRRGHPLRDAANVLGWIEPFVPPEER
jgi:D-alanyl-D-alanine carboxypeptidase (penicillin-binding protein 5/6)